MGTSVDLSRIGRVWLLQEHHTITMVPFPNAPGQG